MMMAATAVRRVVVDTRARRVGWGGWVRALQSDGGPPRPAPWTLPAAAGWAPPAPAPAPAGTQRRWRYADGPV
jgi:hypothetical protein